MKKMEAKKVIRRLKKKATVARALAGGLEGVTDQLENHRVHRRRSGDRPFGEHVTMDLQDLNDLLEGMRETLILLQDDYEKLDGYFAKSGD